MKSPEYIINYYIPEPKDDCSSNEFWEYVRSGKSFIGWVFDSTWDTIEKAKSNLDRYKPWMIFCRDETGDHRIMGCKWKNGKVKPTRFGYISKIIGGIRVEVLESK
jgi:hypothetical protein